MNIHQQEVEPPKFYIPKSFIKRIPWDCRKYIDHFAYLGHILTMAKCLDKRYRNGDAVPLYSIYLQTVLGTNRYKSVLEMAVTCGLIYRNNHYEPSTDTKRGFSRKYRLTEELDHETWVDYRPKNKALIRRLNKWRDKTDVNAKDVHTHLFYWLCKLEIEDVPQEVLDEIAAKPTEGRSTKQERAEILQHSIKDIKENNFRKKPDKYGRFHTNLTNMNSGLRPYLRINNQTLTSIDITNSQPIFLSILLREQLNQPNEKHTSKGNSHNRSLMLSRFEDISLPVNTFSPLPRDFQEFWRLCEQGKLYEDLQHRAGLDVLERKEIKILVFEVLFGHHYLCNEIAKVIKRDFPTVWRLIGKIKKGDYKQLAREMQRRESSFVIMTVCERFRKEYPDIPILTIHDSIITTDENANLVYLIMREEFGKIDLCPALKVEKWNATR